MNIEQVYAEMQELRTTVKLLENRVDNMTYRLKEQEDHIAKLRNNTGGLTYVTNK